jgi:hypothetical protein
VIRLAFDAHTAEAIRTHVVKGAPSEDGAFCLLRRAAGIEGLRLLGTRVFLPTDEDWERRGTGQLRPSARFISRMISEAITAKAGLLFVHSHPNSRFPLGLSPADEVAFTSLAKTVAPMLDGPFAALVVHPAGWSGVIWDGQRMLSIDRVHSVSRVLSRLSPRLAQPISELDLRQKDALGLIHEELQELDIGVVGCGGIGSPIAEQLVRMGVRKVVLIDRDILDTPSNVRRVFGSKECDLRATIPPAKVDVVGRHLDGIGLASVQRVYGDVRTESVFRQLLDTDVVLCGTDSHGSRAIINELAATYFLPVIDIGVKIGSRDDGSLCGLLAEVRILTPTTPCLWCRRTIHGDIIRAENLPHEERLRLIREGYVSNSVGEPAPSVTALTVLASGMGTSALLGLLAEDGRYAPSAYWFDGLLGDSRSPDPREPRPNCLCRKHFGLGDGAQIPFIREKETSR